MRGLEKRFQALWAKSGQNHIGHPVIAHLLDVAASTWAILEREPDSTKELYRCDFALQEHETLGWIYTLAGLHDLGKISPAFQQKWDEGFERLVGEEPEFDWRNKSLKPPEKPPCDISHSLISQVVLFDLLVEKGFNRSVVGKVADAVGCHHGFRAKKAEADEKDYGVGIWDDARKAIFEAVLETVGVTRPPTIKTFSVAAWIRLAGLTSFADWIGSSFYPELTFEGFEDNLSGYYEASKALAEKRLDEIGWTKREILVKEDKSLEQVFDYLVRKQGKTFSPRTLQTKVKALIESTDEPSLLLIEAAMGEGKTEAAFYAYLRLQAQLGHRGLYVALPTMATGNAMFSRTAEFINEHGAGRDLPLDLQLLHGATQLNELYQQLQDKIRPNTHVSQEDRLEYTAAREFFTHKKRALLSEYGVGTVDQALLSVLNIRHHFVRLWGLGNRVVIIDEVHAYDTYTSGLIIMLVRLLHALGSSVILMSATLPKDKRGEILQAYGGEVKEATEYPRIFKVSNGKTTLETFAGDANRKQGIKIIATTSDIDDIVDLIESRLEQGGCAVCIVNTVDRAQQLYERFTGIDKYLFHARFPAEDRAEIEKTVIARFGKNATLENGERPKRAVLIATQVVEQSLDLDFDVMLSDLAPIDLLLQRMGRLWRHQRHDRPVLEAVLYVAGMQYEGELPDLHSHYWDKVYDPYILYKTWEALGEKTVVTLPDDIDPLVQQVYDKGEVRLELSENAKLKIAADQREFEREQLIDKKDSDNAVICHVGNTGGLQLRDATESREEDDIPDGRTVALTRKGEASKLVIPLYKIGQDYFLDAAAQKPYDIHKPPELFLRSVRLSRVSVVGNPKKKIPSMLETCNEQRSKIKDISSAWCKHVLLRSCVPLVLDEKGTLLLGKTKISLSKELGICYEKVC